MPYQTQLFPYAFPVVFKHNLSFEARDSKTPKRLPQIYPLLLLTRDIKFKIGKHIEWVEHNLNFIILPSHNCI